MIGQVIVWIAFAAAIASAFTYYRAVVQKIPKPHFARRTFKLAVGSVIAASVLLMVFILRHQFEYAYIWGYSSRDLPLELLITTFWAGQEGSLLFWTLCGALMGIPLLRYSARKQQEFEVMSIYSLLLAFLLLILILKSPFQSIWAAQPGQLAPGEVPADGKGLNPLLQNFWMIIHPPVLFIGFAALAVPFAFALAALWRRSYSDWLSTAMPWVLFGVLSLGAGLMIGGYWAYGVLGWGGWWGWDPVENSSLIPWILVMILLHTMIVQQRTGKLARTNFVLAILSFVSVVYSTFLTRSGILADASVHSFAEPGALVYTMLLVWIASITVLGFVLLAKRWTELKTASVSVGWLTRESFITIAAGFMAASALIILIGTSTPVFSNSSVEPAFYDRMNLPIAIILGVLLAISLVLQWKEESGAGLFKRTWVALAVSVGVLILLVILGLHDWTMILLAFSSLFALIINTRLLLERMRVSPMALGGPLAHIGLALLFLGIIGSGRYGKKHTVTLILNEPKEVQDYRLTYTGARQGGDGKWHFAVRVENKGTVFHLMPVMYRSAFNDQIMREPDYTSFLTKDFYIEPVSLETTEENTHDHVFELPKGIPTKIDDMTVTLIRFDMGTEHRENMSAGGATRIGALLEVKKGKKTERITATTLYEPGHNPHPTTAMLKDGKTGFKLLSLNAGSAGSAQSSIQVEAVGVHDHPPVKQKPETLIVEASVKPFIAFVWLAALLVTAGSGLAIVRRAKENGLAERSGVEKSRRR